MIVAERWMRRQSRRRCVEPEDDSCPDQPAPAMPSASQLSGNAIGEERERRARHRCVEHLRTARRESSCSRPDGAVAHVHWRMPIALLVRPLLDAHRDRRHLIQQLLLLLLVRRFVVGSTSVTLARLCGGVLAESDVALFRDDVSREHVQLRLGEESASRRDRWSPPIATRMDLVVVTERRIHAHA